MATIKAPFNFVPLSDKVFFPDWADQISQDIPFSDGLSGTIELKITAKTPIFVRNGHTRDDAEAKKGAYKSFSKAPDGKYFIPGTSIKGAIRSVLEIMSFGKMPQVDDQYFGIRNLEDREYTRRMRKVHCGWLSQQNGMIKIEDCGEPLRVSIKNIDNILGGTDLYDFISKNDFKDEKDKLARKKYEIIYQKQKGHKDAKLKTKEDYEKFLDYEDYLLSDDTYTYVLTGQSSKRYFDETAEKPKVGKDGKTIGCWKGKEKEFAFNKSASSVTYDVSNDLFKQFEKIHKESEDYANFWRIKLTRGQKIPVFFIVENKAIHSIGLSGLYRYPSQKSIYDCIPADLRNPQRENIKDFRMDLAECIFGFTFGEKALRGRVHFGHAFACGQPTPLMEKVFISATPHPSYYPLYVKKGWDWNGASEISGRKRYPIRNQANYNNEGTGNMEQVTSMLNHGTVFTEIISFHNLKPIELGALLSALTFHGMKKQCFHNMGFGKAFGYGKVKIGALKLNYVDQTDENFYILQFEKAMDSFFMSGKVDKKSEQEYENGWLKSPQMKQLFAMAAGIPIGKEKEFQYLKMSIDNLQSNEFLQVKKDGTSLSLFTKIIGKDFSVLSIEENKNTLEENEVEKKMTNSQPIVPTTLKKGEVVNAQCIKTKMVRIANHEYDIQLVVPKHKDPKSLIGKEVKISIVQISNSGKIVQVKLVE